MGFGFEDIKAISEFINLLHEISKSKKENEIRNATEACLNGYEITKQINIRLDKLLLVDKLNSELSDYLNKEFIPSFEKISDWSRKKYLENEMDFFKDISINQLTMSPVDVGFHNCMRFKNKLYFLDFEYFGIDDPVKLVSDSVQHPGSMLTEKQNYYFENNLNYIFKDDTQYLNRLKFLKPLFGLKWCMIMLNPFLRSYQNKTNDDNLKKIQLNKSIKKSRTIFENVFY